MSSESSLPKGRCKPVARLKLHCCRSDAICLRGVRLAAELGGGLVAANHIESDLVDRSTTSATVVALYA